MGLGPRRESYAKLAIWRFPAVLASVSFILQAAGPSAAEALRFERAPIAGGQLWRLLTGHLVHLGWSHLLLNIAGLALIWALLGQCYRPLQWLMILALSATVIDTGFLWLQPQLAWYVGLSGVLHGMLAAGVVRNWTAGGQGRLEAAVLGAFLLGKLAYEHLAGATPSSEWLAGGPVVTEAHLYGACGGLLAAVVLEFGNRIGPNE